MPLKLQKGPATADVHVRYGGQKLAHKLQAMRRRCLSSQPSAHMLQTGLNQHLQVPGHPRCKT